MAKHPALVALSDEKKGKLALLFRAFDLDASTMRVTTGKEATDLMDLIDHPPQNLYDTASMGLSPERLAELEERNAAKAVVKKGASLFGEGSVVRIRRDPQRVAYLVVRIETPGTGRTPYWCRLKYHANPDAPCKKLVHELDLDPVE